MKAFDSLNKGFPMPKLGTRILHRFAPADPFIKYLGLDGETIDESDKGYSSEEIDYGISIFATCTNCTIDISGTNAHRTAASNDDLNTLLGNGNTITLNDTLGSELHTSANAASDPNENEADATTGWTPTNLTGTGANVFESQGAVKSTGSYALHSDANDTPTNQARFYTDLEAAPFNISDDDVVRLEFDVRHIGSGGAWAASLGVSNGAATNVMKTFQPTDTTFQTVVYYWTHDGNHRYLNFKEVGDDAGGVYADNLSVKKVTFD